MKEGHKQCNLSLVTCISQGNIGVSGFPGNKGERGLKGEMGPQGKTCLSA